MSPRGIGDLVEGKKTSLKKKIVKLFAVAAIAFCAAKGYDAAVQRNLVNPELKKLIAKTSAIVQKASFDPQMDIDPDRNARSIFIAHFGHPAVIDFSVGRVDFTNSPFVMQTDEDGSSLDYYWEVRDEKKRGVTFKRSSKDGFLEVAAELSEDMKMTIRFTEDGFNHLFLDKATENGTLTYVQAMDADGKYVFAVMDNRIEKGGSLQEVNPIIPFKKMLRVFLETSSLLGQADKLVLECLASEPNYPSPKAPFPNAPPATAL